jgi:RNA recognition motif. (a.k.a. RRM, RBD, or RNP domain)
MSHASLRIRAVRRRLQGLRREILHKLFVGNLSFDTTENDLQDAFAAHGTVVETNLMMDRTTVYYQKTQPRSHGGLRAVVTFERFSTL